jgi:hypothetical protein
MDKHNLKFALFATFPILRRYLQIKEKNVACGGRTCPIVTYSRPKSRNSWVHIVQTFDNRTFRYDFWTVQNISLIDT